MLGSKSVSVSNEPVRVIDNSLEHFRSGGAIPRIGGAATCGLGGSDANMSGNNTGQQAYRPQQPHASTEPAVYQGQQDAYQGGGSGMGGRGNGSGFGYPPQQTLQHPPPQQQHSMHGMKNNSSLASFVQQTPEPTPQFYSPQLRRQGPGSMPNAFGMGSGPTNTSHTDLMGSSPGGSQFYINPQQHQQQPHPQQTSGAFLQQAQQPSQQHLAIQGSQHTLSPQQQQQQPRLGQVSNSTSGSWGLYPNVGNNSGQFVGSGQMAPQAQQRPQQPFYSHHTQHQSQQRFTSSPVTVGGGQGNVNGGSGIRNTSSPSPSSPTAAAAQSHSPISRVRERNGSTGMRPKEALLSSASQSSFEKSPFFVSSSLSTDSLSTVTPPSTPSSSLASQVWQSGPTFSSMLYSISVRIQIHLRSLFETLKLTTYFCSYSRAALVK